MQIKRLHIDKNLCLENFDIRFATKNGGSSTILIGPNGSGKSTMLKSLLSIMMSFDSMVVAKNLNFNYEMEYVYAEKEIYIKKKGFNYDISIDKEKYQGTMEKINAYFADRIRIFPQRIIAFYSGNNNAFYDEIRRQNFQYKKKCKSNYDDYLKLMVNGAKYDKTSLPKRKYIYCDESFVPIYLIAILAGSNSNEKTLLQKECQLSKIRDVYVSMNINSIDIAGKTNFMKNERAVQRNLLSFIEYVDYRFVPLFEKGLIPSRNRDKLFFSISNLEELHCDSVSLLEFFEKLKIFYSAEYVVNMKSNNADIQDINLSEGQRQLVKILGMLGVCKKEDCLVLMDEPDAHMNPLWKYNIKEIIDNILKSSNNTQAIIATHDPLVINGVSKNNIRIFERNQETEYITNVIEPDIDTEGMGIDGLLQSEYYGLKSSYDKNTTKDFVDRQKLYEKLINGKITDQERARLRTLTEKIGFMPISANTIDFLYDDFIREFRKTEYYKKEYLSFNEIKKRNEKIKKIIQDLYENK